MADIFAAVTNIGLGKVVGAVLVVGLFILAIKSLGGNDGDKGKKNDSNSNSSNSSSST